MVGVETKGKRQRSDKKRDVKPTILVELKDAVYRLSYITKTSVKDVVEQMIIHSINSRKIVDDLSKYFRRQIHMNDTIFRGNIGMPRIAKREEGEREQVTTRLKQRDYEIVSALAYALDVSPTRVCAILLDAAMRDFHFINSYVRKYLTTELTPGQLNELQKILLFVNNDDEIEEKLSLADLLSLIVNEVSTPITKLKDTVNDFIIKNWRD